MKDVVMFACTCCYKRYGTTKEEMECRLLIQIECPQCNNEVTIMYIGDMEVLA